MKTIVEQIFDNASDTPDKTALTDGKNILTYRELTERILASKKALSENYGLTCGDAVIIAADKQLSFVAVYFACHLLGAVVLPIAPDTNENRFRFIQGKVRPRLVIGFEDSGSSCKTASLKEFDALSETECLATISYPEIDQIADIIFTTGTTGEPKGVELSQRNIMAAARNINGFIRNTRNDVEMLALPISHSFGLGRLRCALSNGQTVVILGSFANMKRFFRYMEVYHVTGFGMVPASWAMMKKLSGTKITEYASQLAYIEIGSAPMPMADKELLMSLLPETRICMHYGLTEASRSAFLEFHAEKEHLDTVGRQTPGMEIEIRDETGKPVPDGMEGEICVRGDCVTKGYHDLADCNADTFFGEYFRTGDWGTRDSNGYIRLCSRKKELINVGGKKVSPVEVEQVLTNLDYIEECVCVAISDPEGIMGEVVKAFVVTKQKEKIVAGEINKELSGYIEDYKLPREYEIIDEIPKTASGKLQRLILTKKNG